MCAILNYDHRVSAVVSFAGFNKPMEVTKEQAVSEAGGIYYLIAPQIWAMQIQLFGDLLQLTAVDGINRTHIPVMVVLCSNDTLVPVNTISIYAQRDSITNPYVEYLYLEGDKACGHYFKNYPEDKGLLEQVNAFFEDALKQ